MQNTPFLISHAPEILVGAAVATTALVAALSPDGKRLRRTILTIAYIMWIATVFLVAFVAAFALCFPHSRSCDSGDLLPIAATGLIALAAPPGVYIGMWATRAQ